MFDILSGLPRLFPSFLCRKFLALGFLFVLISLQLAEAGDGNGADWPMWRYDANRSASSPVALPPSLSLQWIRELPTPKGAWPEEQIKLQFDRSYEPVVKGSQVFVGSMVQDSITAYDLASGRENWRFYCDGPVRFAPLAWRDRVFTVSDDGYLYALDATTGSQVWRRRLAPRDRRVLGNGRLISAWPARGGPVLMDNTLYCAAGIWPFMGIFIVAVDPASGEIVWQNSGSGATYTRQQHSSDAFAGVAPQGYLTATAEDLLIPSRTAPACFQRENGDLRYYRLADREEGKYVGGYNVAVWRDWFLNNGTASRLNDGLALGKIDFGVCGAEAYYTVDEKNRLVAYAFGEKEKIVDKKKNKTRTVLTTELQWQSDARFAFTKVHCQAGQQIYASDNKGSIVAVEIPQTGQRAHISWRDRVPGKVWTMLAAQGRLLVVTEEGRLYCYGSSQQSVTTPVSWYKKESLRITKALPEARQQTRRLLSSLPLKEGYALFLGASDKALLRELLRQSKLHVIALDPNTERIPTSRRLLTRQHRYGTRVAILPGTIDSHLMPPYLASLIVVEDIKTAGLNSPDTISKLYQCLRPYGGIAWLSVSEDQQLAFLGDIRAADLPGVQVSAWAGGLSMQRSGALPGTSNWTHQYGDVANTVCSLDPLKPPLGLLWFGEESSFGEVLPRHAHGPSPQVAGGRLFIQGVHSLTARDVYTGRTLWTQRWKNLGTAGVYYDDSYVPDYRDLSYNQKHIPGASVRGTNFVVTDDCVYIVKSGNCLVLDAAKGTPMATFTLPGHSEARPREWGYIGIYEDTLVAGADFVDSPKLPSKGKGNSKEEKKKKDLLKYPSFLGKNASQQLVVMNRYTGQVLWSLNAQHGFLHNAIVAGKDQLYCIDGKIPSILELNRLRDLKERKDFRLAALDIRTGAVLWERTEGVFGSWLGYSREHDVLLQAYRQSRDMLWEPGNRMAAHLGASGKLLWDKAHKYSGPCILHDKTIYTQEAAYDLNTGERVKRLHPLTGEALPWSYKRNYGCGTATASQNLLLFRSAAAGYYDIANDGGTGNLGGFRAGCTSNMIIADGVLNAPDYTSTCTCSYQNQTSLALVHMPEVEEWTFTDIKPGKKAIRRLGLNFGAPGDRKAENGTLWLDCPSQGGPSPDPEVDIKPTKITPFRQHSTQLSQGSIKWVQASGITGARHIVIELAPSGKASPSPSRRVYTVRLFFVEPETVTSGQRVFDVSLQGESVLEAFDIVAEAGTANVGLVKEFPGVVVKGALEISLVPRTPDKDTLLCGIEVVSE